MSIRTDLAIEQIDFATEITPEGVKKEVISLNEIEVTKISITNSNASKNLSKPIGDYVTIQVSSFNSPSKDFETEIKTIAEVLSKMLADKKREVLVVGLGNQNITPDALGPRAIEYIFATRHISNSLANTIGLNDLNSVSAISTGVLGQTGIETSEIVASIVKKLNPSAVIVIDALAAKSINRLSNTLQITNTGISPGSGVQNKRKALSKETLGVDVIAIGVPTVVDMGTIALDIFKNDMDISKISDEVSTMMVTPREIDLAIEHAAKTIGFAINKALQPNLSLDDIIGLVG